MRYFDNTNPRKNRKITHFPDEITITIGGKKQNIRKMIAKASEDTGIYEQIEKYGIDVNTQPSIEETVMDFTGNQRWFENSNRDNRHVIAANWTHRELHFGPCDNESELKEIYQPEVERLQEIEKNPVYEK